LKGPEPDPGGGASEALRSAIERTFAATAGSAADTRDRAGELLDDVARRGQEARDEVARRGQEARDEVARRGQEARHGVSDRIASALERLRGVDVDAMQREIDGLRRRVADLEQQLRSKSKPKG
jgi:polyhydroxyalkanoate synthesis regulator phasin